MEGEDFALHTEQASVLEYPYPVLHDRDFELLRSAAAVPGTGVGMLPA
jgi:hypothetical protein